MKYCTALSKEKLWGRDLWEGKEYPGCGTFESGSTSPDLFKGAASNNKIAMMTANFRNADGI